MKQNPWLGLASYDEEAISKGYKFCGREQVVDELYSIIDNNICTILYGKSGIGKSSLLKAGIFPRLRADNYLPVFIRLGAINDNEHDYVDIVKGKILNAVNQIDGKRIAECRYKDDHIDSFLWNFFQNSEFRNNHGDTIFPVIVLDQFEELYYKDRQKLNLLLRSLYRLLDDSSITITSDVKSPNYRLVLSIREDDIFHLEDSIDKLRLVELKGNWYRLRELNDQEAREVILQPCSDLFYSKEVDKIVNRIVEESKAGKDEISTAILSLICSKIYDTYIVPNMLVPNGEVGQIVYSEVKLFFEQAGGNFLRCFYDDVIKELRSPSKWYYIEDALVTDEGRRNSVLKSEFDKMIPNSSFLFKGEKSILRYVSVKRDDEPRVELIHDILAQQMKSSRNERKLRQETARLRKRHAMAIGAVCVMLGLGLLYFLQYRSILSERNGMLKMQAHYIAELADGYMDQGMTILPARLLVKVLPRLKETYAVVDKSVRQLDFNIGNVEALFFHGDDVRTIVFSEAEDVVLTSSFDSTAKLWNIRTGEQEGSSMVHCGGLMSAVFSPNEQYILTASLDSTARLWSRRGEFVGNAMKHDGGICSAVFSPRGDYVVTASKDSTSKLWNLKGEHKGVTMRHEGCVNMSLFSPQGDCILTVSSDSTAKLWDVNGRHIGHVMRHRGNICYAAFNTNGDCLVTASVDSTAKLWNAVGDQIAEMKHNGSVNMAIFSPRGNYILTTSSDSTARLWDSKGNYLATMKHNGYVSSGDFSADEEYFVTASWDRTVKLWNIKGEQVGETMIHDSMINDVAFSPSGEYVAAALNDRIVQVWNANSISDFINHSAEINSMEFSQDERYLVISYRDSTAILWDLITRVPMSTVMKHDGSVNSASFNNNGNYVVTASNDSTARLWDLNGNELAQPMKHNASVCSASFNYNGRYIVTASKDSTVRLWNLSGEQVGETIKHPDCVNFAVFSPVEDYILTACADQTARLWNINGDIVRDDLEHDSNVCYVAYSDDGNYILTASADETAILWNMKSGDSCKLEHNCGVKSAFFSPCGNYIVTISDENDVLLWNMKGELITEIKTPEDVFASATFSPVGDAIALASVQGRVIIKEFLTLSELTDKYKKLLRSWELSEDELVEYHFK